MRVTSEGPTKITKATIDAAWRRRKSDQRLIVRDRDCRGLALIVNANSMTWSYAYRPRGVDPNTGKRWPNRTASLGNPASHSVEDARLESNRMKGQAAAGADPAAERRAKAEAVRRQRSNTLEQLAHQYARVLPRRPKMHGAGLPSAAYVAIELAQVRLALTAMDASVMPAADLTSANVRQLLDTEDVNPRARFGALARFLDWCQDTGHIQANPCALIARARRPKAPQARAHYLTPTQLACLWRGAERLGEPVWRDISQFLVAIPCRRGEAARMEWSHVDLIAAEWRQPGRLTKSGQPHRLRLHPLALDVLRSRRLATSGKGLVFPAPLSGGAVNTFTDLKAKLTEAADLTDWTWHDFRRSFATALGEAGVSEAVADAVLNHRQSATRGGVLGVYQRATRWAGQLEAMETWGRLLASAIEGHEVAANGPVDGTQRTKGNALGHP